jgi:hypothetical protein
MHRELLHEPRLRGLHFGAAGYWVSTDSRDEISVRRSFREQDQWDQGKCQMFE